MRGTGKNDPALTRYRKSMHRLKLVFWDGSYIHDEPLRSIRTFDFVMEDGRVIDKITCIGVFPIDGDDLIQSRAHPVSEIKKSPKDRLNGEKINSIQQEMMGANLRVILVNGWQLEGVVIFLTPFQIVIKGRPHSGISLFRHAIADFEVLNAPEETQEGRDVLKKVASERARELAASSSMPSLPGNPLPRSQKTARARPKPAAQRVLRAKKSPPALREIEIPSPKAPTASIENLSLVETGALPPSPPLARPDVQPAGPFVWAKLLPLNPERTVVNAKIKLVLKEVSTLREVGDLYWLPLTNQPRDVIGGIELSASPLDLLIPKKIWNEAQETAKALKAQSGEEPLYLIEAPVGIQQNRLAAVVGSIQVISEKTDAPPSGS